MKILSLLFALFLAVPAFASPPSGKPAGLSQSAKVVSTIKAPPYTYIEVAQGKQTRWLAATIIAVKAGDVIQFDDGQEMRDFHSKTLQRTFPSILFVNKVEVVPAR
jgi:hypothetical protein